MLYRRVTVVSTALIGVLFSSSALAVSATAVVSAIVVEPVQVIVDASTQLLVSSTAGVLMLSIPGGGGATPSSITPTASGIVPSVSPSVFSFSDSAGLAAVIRQIATSGGTLSSSGALSGSGVQIVVLPAPVGGRGTVTAIVTYT